ncbi:DUF305 domain-containing protein [Nocardia sp. NPDC050712]|uniref:DUF305 domain-containing protein n=1 Tax=Nocardia sp. NPDC050712 TaxID=3155518 RepID=UPI0033D82FC3
MARRQVLLAVACLLAGAVLGFWVRAPAPQAPAVTLSAVDIGFAQDMSVHHEQAVLLSRTLAADASPQIRGIAERIVLAQTGEIAQMRGWLQLHELPLTTAEPMAWMAGQHAHGGPPMPGLAATSEITRLAGLRGADAEILFLQLMIRHHHGGIEMAQAAFNTGSNAVIKRVALDMVNEQGNEAGQMTALLTARNAQPLS